MYKYNITKTLKLKNVKLQMCNIATLWARHLSFPVA